MHKFFKTNAGLGYGKYAYLLKLQEGKFLCCNNIDFYVSGSIIIDMGDTYPEIVEDKESFIDASEIHEDLINYLVEKS